MGILGTERETMLRDKSTITKTISLYFIILSFHNPVSFIYCVLHHLFCKTYICMCNLASDIDFTLFLNSLPNGKILDWLKLKSLTNDKIKCDSNIELFSQKGRKHCGKRRKCS